MYFPLVVSKFQVLYWDLWIILNRLFLSFQESSFIFLHVLSELLLGTEPELWAVLKTKPWPPVPNIPIKQTIVKYTERKFILLEAKQRVLVGPQFHLQIMTWGLNLTRRQDTSITKQFWSQSLLPLHYLASVYCSWSSNDLSDLHEISSLPSIRIHLRWQITRYCLIVSCE